MNPIIHRSARKASVALALSLSIALAGCGGMPTNRSVESIHQPVVEQVNYTLDVPASSGGLGFTEQRRIAGWFDVMRLRYGDRISVDDPLASEATRQSIEALASRYGLLVSAEAPVTEGYVSAGTVRIVVSRSKATVPGCPDWSAKSDANLNNATSTNYGCAVNSNLASMVANPEHLLKGADEGGDTTVMSSTKAIEAYRKATPTGNGNTVKQTGVGGS